MTIGVPSVKDARPEALISMKNEITLTSLAIVTLQIPLDGIVGEANETSHWAMRKIAMVTKVWGRAVTWIKVHLFGQPYMDTQQTSFPSMKKRVV